MGTHNIANIILASSDTAQIEDFSKKLKDFKLNVWACSPDQLQTEATDKHPDLIVIDTSCPDYDGFDLARSVKDDRRHIDTPVVLLAKEKNENLYVRAQEVRADDIFIASFDIKEFVVHSKPLLRLSTMFTELEGRTTLAKELGIEVVNEVKPDETTPYSILLINPTDGDRATLETILDGHCSIDVCEDIFNAEDMLCDGLYDAAVCGLNIASRETIYGLSSRIRNNPRLFNLPVLVLSEELVEDRFEAFQRGVTRIVHRPLSHASLKAKLIMLVRRQRLRWSIRNAMDTTRHPSVIDQGTKAYTNDFLIKNLNAQVNLAQKWNKDIAVIHFSISNIPSIKEQFGKTAADLLIQQVYQWIASLTRVEDLVARAEENQFFITLPDTPKNEAQIVMHRIAGILSYTDFAIEDVFQPLSVWVESGLTSLRTSDTGSDLLERARKNID